MNSTLRNADETRTEATIENLEIGSVLLDLDEAVTHVDEPGYYHPCH